MSVHVDLLNQTSANVIFGLWSAPNDYSTVQKVSANGSQPVTLDHPDARIVGVWTDSNNLYPSNNKPFTTGADFQNGGSYTVTLTDSGITVMQALAGATN